IAVGLPLEQLLIDQRRLSVDGAGAFGEGPRDVGRLLPGYPPVEPVTQVLVPDQGIHVLETALDVDAGHQVVIAQNVTEVQGGPTSDVGAELTAPQSQGGAAYICQGQ